MNAHHAIDSLHVPIELEIGSRRGEVLKKLAESSLDTFFLGIDIDAASCQTALHRLNHAGLSNADVLCVEASQFVATCIPSGRLRAIHVYFPTPYPNAICLRDNLLSPEFLAEAHRSLCLYGSLRIVTDHAGYFRSTLQNIRRGPWKSVAWQPLALGQPEGMAVGSPLEYRWYGTTEIYRAQFVK